jgi:hypothetical protein
MQADAARITQQSFSALSILSTSRKLMQQE